MITEDRWKSLQRIAEYGARRWQSNAPLPFPIRYEAALDGVVAALADGVDDDHGLIAAGEQAVARYIREVTKHHKHLSYWDPPAMRDALAEDITDRVGVHQLSWAFTDHQWAVVYATAEAAGTGTPTRVIAEGLGLTVAVYTDTLMRARKRARKLWIAPGETPSRRRYAAGNRPGVHRYIHHHRSYVSPDTEGSTSDDQAA
jgi:hypothetical protein